MQKVIFMRCADCAATLGA